MNLYFRCLLVWVLSLFRPRLGLLDISVLKLRVLPGDLDIYGHMNNGRYLTIMDLGRFDLILRSPLGKIIRRRQWNPIVAASTVSYYRPLQVFDGFELHTRVVAWDEKWVYLEQRFEKKGKLAAAGLIKGLLVGREGSVPTEAWLKETGAEVQAPVMPENVRAFHEMTARKEGR